MSEEKFIFLFQKGNYYDSPDIVKVFDNSDKALKKVTRGFLINDSLSIPNKYWFIQNKKKRKWISIKKMKVE